MTDMRSRILRSKLVDLSVSIARSHGHGSRALADELDRTIAELEAHEGREICLHQELDDAPPAQIIAMVEPIRDRLVDTLTRTENPSDRACLSSALEAVEAKIERAVRAMIAKCSVVC